MDDKPHLNDGNKDTAPTAADTSLHEKSKDKEKDKSKHRTKRSHWALISTGLTFVFAAIFSLLSTLASQFIIVSAFLLVFLILLNILSDGIGVAVTAVELPPLLAMASRRAPGSRMAVKLVKNAEKVANICSDIVGDICGIISGACGLSLAYALLKNASSTAEFWLLILFSSIISALTVGGKAFIKDSAIKNSKSIVLGVARVLSLFSPDPREKRERIKEKNRKRESEAQASEQEDKEDDEA